MPTIAPIVRTAQIGRFSVVTLAALTLAAWVSSGFAQRLEPSGRQRVTQNETAPSNEPTVPRSTTESAPVRTPSPPGIAKWQQSLVAHLAGFKKYPAQGGAGQGVVSLTFTLDRKGNVVSSRIEKTSGSTFLDAEALAMVMRAAPLPAPPPDVADADLTFVVPIRFTAGQQR
jgi:periplasmic protein TonB